MRYQKLGLVLLGCATLLVAADPFAGTWKLNPAKSKFHAGAPAKQQSVVMAQAGADLDVNITGTAADGTAIASHYTVPINGGNGKIISSPYDGVDSKHISATHRQTTYFKGGKAVLNINSRISADGKAITVDVKGTDGAGKPLEGTAIFEKQ